MELRIHFFDLILKDCDSFENCIFNFCRILFCSFLTQDQERRNKVRENKRERQREKEQERERERKRERKRDGWIDRKREKREGGVRNWQINVHLFSVVSFWKNCFFVKKKNAQKKFSLNGSPVDGSLKELEKSFSNSISIIDYSTKKIYLFHRLKSKVVMGSYIKLR